MKVVARIFGLGILLTCPWWVQAEDIPSTLSSPGVSIVAPDLRSADLMSDVGTNSNQVLTAAYASLAAYESEWGKLPYRTLEKSGWHITPHKTDKVRFIVASRHLAGKEILILAVSGTERKVDLKLNLLKAAVPAGVVPGAKVHEGYKEIAESLYRTHALQDVLRAHQRGADLLVTGHSLGGSVAALLGGALIHEGKADPKRLKIITFAAPDMANRTAVELLSEYPLVNYTMRADWIPRVFHLLQGSYDNNPKNINWEVHSPEVTFPHAMILFLDEAFYQAALTFDADPVQVEEPWVYVSAGPLEENMNMPADLQRAYRNTVIKSAVLGCQKTVYRNYVSRDLTAALAEAKERNARYLLWIPMQVISEKESRLRTYALRLEPQWYDVGSGRLLHWTSFVFDNNRYTIFPTIVDRLSEHAWYPTK